MYIKKIWNTGQVIEIEKTCSFKYKGKRTARGTKKEKSNEAMKALNERNAKKKLRRLLNLNFDNHATHTVLTYRAENRTTDSEKAKKDLAKFWRALKWKCKKAGKELKYVAVAEHGKRSIHFHCVLDCGLPLAAVQECWPHGVIHSTPLYGNDYAQLADYLVKETSKTFNDPQLSVHRKRWNASRNLKQPAPVIEIIKADSWRESPIAPKGFFVLSDSVESGISEITGWPYQYYRCYKINTKGEESTGRKAKNKNHRANTAKY